MSEPEEEMNHMFRSKPKDFLTPPPRTTTTTTQHTVAAENQNQREPSLMMDLDLDLDASWSFDQIFAAAAASNNHMSPFLVSTTASEQPCSPLWAFSDENEDNKPSTGNALSAASLRLSSYPRFLTCKPRAHYTCCFQHFWNYVWN